MRANKITIGCRVKGKHGLLVPNPRGHHRRVHEVVSGKVIESVEHNQCKVKLDIDGREVICSSRLLTIIEIHEWLPVNEEFDDSTETNSEEALHNDLKSISDDEDVPNGDWYLADEMLDFLDSEETQRHKNNFEKAWE